MACCTVDSQGFIQEFHLGGEAHGLRGRKATARGRVREGDVPPPARSVKPKNTGNLRS